MQIKMVIWDIDNVWYDGISTTHVAYGSRADPQPYLKEFVEDRKWFTYDDVTRWKREKSRDTSTVGDVADMLTDFLYGDFRDTVYSGIPDQEAKTRTIVGKQALLRGLTIGDVKWIADQVPYTQGLRDAIGELSIYAYQVGFSDGLGPFVAYKMLNRGIPEIGGIVPAKLIEGVGSSHATYWFDKDSLDLIHNDGLMLTGETGGFKKSEAIFDYIAGRGKSLSEVAVIDDSASNLGTLSKVRDGGGVAIAFNPSSSHRKKFESAGIPILEGKDLWHFALIVKDPSLLAEYCE